MSPIDFPKRRWKPQVHAWLCERLQRPGLLCLDWDETCAAGDIGDALLHFLDEDGTHRQRYNQRLGEGHVLQAYVEACFILADMDVNVAKAQCEAAVAHALKTGAVRLRPEIQDLMAAARQSGWTVWVVSASVTPVVQAIAALYGQPPEQVLGMDLVIKSGRYQAELDGPATYRQGKVDAIMNRIGRVPDLALGDTLTDLEMLLSAKDALLIGPRHSDLLPIAKEKGWAIQPVFEDFESV
jgi:phosphoserine phosphatase